MAKVFIKPRKARPFWFGHPWVFSGAVERVRGRVADGDEVEVLDHEGRLIGRGFFNGRSQIRVRLVALAHEEGAIADLLDARLRSALRLRLETLRLPAVTNAFRLVHAEGDGLPGLVVDRLGDVLVFQVSCLGLVPHLERLLGVLELELHPGALIERSPGGVAEEEGLEREPGVVRGCAPEGPLAIEEAGVRYFCDPVGGQKTGWFADQRDNRVALAPLAAEKEVLDAFTYVGGFGLRMAREGAARVHLLDSSAPSLELARKGAEANGVLDRVEIQRGNVLRVLDHMHKEGRRFDVVVVDPPRLVRRRKDLRKGLRLYGEINFKAVRVLRPDGILVTCSCSQHVAEEDFEEVLAAVAKETRTRFQVIQRGGQGPDHPVLLPLTESRYLKVRAIRVRA